MTTEPFTYENYEEVREQLVLEINKSLTEHSNSCTKQQSETCWVTERA